MKRRWFQFSLRTAIVMMLITAVGIGVWLRWPYYRASRALDAAVQNPQFEKWQLIRSALIQDEEFREEAGKQDYWHITLEIESQQSVSVVLSHSDKRSDRKRLFNFYIGADNEISMGRGMSANIHDDF